MRHELVLLLSVLCLLAGCKSGAPSHDRPGAVAIDPRARPALDVPRAATRPAMTADPADPAWRSAAAIAALPLSIGAPARHVKPIPTQVRVMWDPDWLYVRFLCDDTEIYAPFTGRDQMHYQGDVVEIFLDPVGDARQYIELQVTATNQIFDQLLLITAEPESDANGELANKVFWHDFWMMIDWTLPNLRTAARVEGKQWIVDVAIPAEPLLRRLGQKQFTPMTLRAQFMRYDWNKVEGQSARRLTAMNWSPVTWGNPHKSPQAYGELILRP